MKISISVGLLALANCAALQNSPAGAAPSHAGSLPRVAASKEVARVTPDNFISFSWQQSGGIAGLTTSIQVEGNTLTLSSGRAGESTSETRHLSNNQLNALLQKANDTQFTTLVGNYRQPNLADGFNEVAVLTISDKKNRDQTFTVQNYDDAAPKKYYQFIAYVRDLAQMKTDQKTVAFALPFSGSATSS